MNLAVAADHAGVELKRELVCRLRAARIEILDLGVHTTRAVDYPDCARAVAEAMIAGRAYRGILICGSAVGVSVAACKFPGIRAAVCHDSYSARQGVEHDDLNILCLGARIIGAELAWDLVKIFLAARFSAEERHIRRLSKIEEIELSAPISRPRRSPRSAGRRSRTASSGPSGGAGGRAGSWHRKSPG